MWPQLFKTCGNIFKKHFQGNGPGPAYASKNYHKDTLPGEVYEKSYLKQPYFAVVVVSTVEDNRVAKCHGYDGYIRVKIFRCWGKKPERTHNMTKLGLF